MNQCLSSSRQILKTNIGFNHNYPTVQQNRQEEENHERARKNYLINLFPEIEIRISYDRLYRPINHR